MFEVVLEEQARHQLAKLPPKISRGISRKLRWLGKNAEVIKHERLTGREEYSLHFGQYRIPYLLYWTNQVITVTDIDKHDEAYRRLKKRR